jgi:hypothetical protein
MPWVEHVDIVDGRLQIHAPADAGQAINRVLAEKGIYASMIAPQKNTLEDLFLELTESDAEGAGSELSPNGKASA